MAETLKKVRVQLLNPDTNEVIEDVDVMTSASAVTFADGSTLQEKANQGDFGYDDTELKNLVNGKADKATTLAGYGIDDAYTKSEVDAKVSSVYKYKGSKANKSALPSSGNVVGDVWNLEGTGMNVAWTGTAWDELGSNVDLTDYLTKDEAVTTYAAKTHTHTKSQISDFPESMPANGGNADTVNGHTVEANVPSDAKFTDTTYSKATSSNDGLMPKEDKAKIDKLENVKYGASTLAGTEVKLFLKVVE